MVPWLTVFGVSELIVPSAIGIFMVHTCLCFRRHLPSAFPGVNPCLLVFTASVMEAVYVSVASMTFVFTFKVLRVLPLLGLRFIKAIFWQDRLSILYLFNPYNFF